MWKDRGKEERLARRVQYRFLVLALVFLCFFFSPKVLLAKFEVLARRLSVPLPQHPSLYPGPFHYWAFKNWLLHTMHLPNTTRTRNHETGVSPEAHKIGQISQSVGVLEIYLSHPTCHAYATPYSSNLLFSCPWGQSFIWPCLTATSILELQKTKSSAFHLSWHLCCVLPS